VPINRSRRGCERELDLVKRMLAGEQRAFDGFFASYAPRLATFASRRSNLPAASIEDVVQNSLLKALRNLHSFRAESALFTWLCQICRNELADLYQTAARRPACESLDSDPFIRGEVFELHAPAEGEPQNELGLEVHRREIVTALKRLPEQYAYALEWKYGDGFSVQQIAEMLGLTSMATQSLLARARTAFKESWRQEQSRYERA
jgi:RNA polymerase sigma-70 factor, ECF subfamily